MWQGRMGQNTPVTQSGRQWSLQHASPAHQAGKHAMLPSGKGRCRHLLVPLMLLLLGRQMWCQSVNEGVLSSRGQ